MNISLLDPLGIPQGEIDQFAAKLKKLGHSFTYYDTKTTDVEELKRRSRGQEIVMIANNPYPADVIRSADALKMIAVAFTGIDHVGLDACKEKDIMVCNCAGYSNLCVAEQAIGMTISVLRFFSEDDKAVRAQGTSAGLVGSEIAGKTVGIIGCGQIGFRTAQLFKAFGAKVIACARHERDEVKAAGIEYRPLPDLLAESDIISLHTPNNAQTKGMIGKDEIARMKPAHAPAPVQPAGQLAGAAVDVFDMEPPIPGDYPLLHAKNTLLTPHVAFLTKEAMLRRAEIEFDNVLSYLENNPKNICKL